MKGHNMNTRRLLRTLFAGLAIFALGGLLATNLAPVDAAAQETDGQALFFNVSTDDVWAANMAISLATRSASEGNETILFLNVRAVYLADSGRMPETAGNSDMNIHEKLQHFHHSGGTIIACPMCSSEAGLTQDDYIDGVTVGEPGGVLTYLTDPRYTVISY